MVEAGIPVTSISFLAALPVGASNANFSGLILNSSINNLTIHLTIVVLPVPGPPVIIVKLLFNAKGLYSDLLIRNNINTDLVKNINYSDNYKKMIEAFKNLKYEYYLIFSPNLLLYNENISKNLVKEYINTNNYNEFINSNGFEFLIFIGLYLLNFEILEVILIK